MAKLSDKLAEAIVKHGPKVVGKTKILINDFGIDPTKLKPTIVKKAEKKAAAMAKKAKPDKAVSKKDKAPKKTDKKTKPDKEAKVEKKSKKNKAEEKTKPEKSDKKKSKSDKAKGSGEHGNRYTIKGYPAGGFLRYMGFHGYSKSECRKAANKFGAKEMSDNAVKCAQYDGVFIKKGKGDSKKTGKGLYGKCAEVAKKDFAEVKQYVEKLRSKAG